jgi:hypothetical protein
VPEDAACSGSARRPAGGALTGRGPPRWADTDQRTGHPAVRASRALDREPRPRSPGAQRGRDARAVAAGRQLVPRDFEFALPFGSHPRDPARARTLLAEGSPNGFDGGELTPFPPYNAMGETIQDWLQAVGIRTRMRAMERGAFMTAWREKKLRLRRAARGRRPLPPPGPRAGSQEARGAAPPAPARPARAGDAGPHLSPGLPDRRGGAGGRHHGHRHPGFLMSPYEDLKLRRP